MGLSIAHGVIERHEGTIEVESQEGTGTTFTIHLPVESNLQMSNVIDAIYDALSGNRFIPATLRGSPSRKLGDTMICTKPSRFSWS